MTRRQFKRRLKRRIAHMRLIKRRKQEAPVVGTREWDEIVATAKRRKRSIRSTAEKSGLMFVGGDPKQRESWRGAS